MNVGATLKANAKTTKVVEPCVSTLDHSAKFSQTTASLRFAPVRMALRRTPFVLRRMWCLELGRERSVGIGPVFAYPTARTDEELTAAREKSSWSASRNLASSSSCGRPHTPALGSRASDASGSGQNQIPTWSTGCTSGSRS